MTYALMVCDYSPLKNNTSYRVTEEGVDWVKIRYDGNPVLVSRDLIHPDPMSTLYIPLPLEEVYDEEEDVFNTIFM
jgi:hypothetical protein|tara:strand:- start:176 stop:403 length:228 start_codon:yes stop_codon:yes gene_type:complete